MSEKFKDVLAMFNYPRTLPVYLCVLASKQKKLIEMDVARWNQIDGMNRGLFDSLNWYMTYKKEFRNLLQHADCDRRTIHTAHGFSVFRKGTGDEDRTIFFGLNAVFLQFFLQGQRLHSK